MKVINSIANTLKIWITVAQMLAYCLIVLAIIWYPIYWIVTRKP